VPAPSARAASPELPESPDAAATAKPAPLPDPTVWAALQSELAGRPDELARIADYLGWRDRLQRFMLASGVERRSLAASLDAEIDRHLRQRELSAAEALQVKTALLESLIDDPDARHDALSRWQGAAAPANPGAPGDTERRFAERQAAVVAAWRAQPPAQRNAQELERQLDTLRRGQFDSPTPTPTPIPTGGLR
jgi:hypothetical protein